MLTLDSTLVKVWLRNLQKLRFISAIECRLKKVEWKNVSVALPQVSLAHEGSSTVATRLLELARVCLVAAHLGRAADFTASVLVIVQAEFWTFRLSHPENVPRFNERPQSLSGVWNVTMRQYLDLLSYANIILGI